MSETVNAAAPAPTETGAAAFEAPYPGSHQMPRWTTGELCEPPHFSWRHIPMLLGPGLVLGAAAIGGGEWLTGPLVTAKYGGALLWLATLSILGQVIYNIEISRYALYSGEPIFTGKFRVPPGPIFWPFIYLLLDFGSFLPYLSSNAAIPLTGMILRRLPDPTQDTVLLTCVACGIYLLTLMPMVIGGKVYHSLKIVMTMKLILIMGFLLYLAFGYSTWSTWEEIGSGFFKFGTLPVHGTTESGHAATANWFSYLFSGKEFPALELSMISTITAMAAIAGNGGLTNAPISNYTRDQGWGMGKEVGAIPSIIGGQSIKLSHVGKVFEPNEKSLPRWRGWMRHIQREQLLVWMPACFMGMALPSMLSVQFLPRGVVPANKWLAAGMTASGVSEAVGPKFGPLFWHLTLFCGFLVLATSAVTTSEGCLRRWVDVVWTASPRVRKWDTRDIGRFYFVVLCVYAAFGLIMLNFTKGDRLLVWATNIYNYALGISCFHVVVVNTMLLPRELKPHWLRRAALIAAGTFFMTIAVLTTMDTFGLLAPKKPDSAPAAVEPAPPAPAATPAK